VRGTLKRKVPEEIRRELGILGQKKTRRSYSGVIKREDHTMLFFIFKKTLMPFSWWRE